MSTSMLEHHARASCPSIMPDFVRAMPYVRTYVLTNIFGYLLEESHVSQRAREKNALNSSRSSLKAAR